VSYLPSTRFYASGGGSHALRLAFSLYSPADLTEAAHRLGKAIIQLVEKG
jgi:DNA-binding transcriptional MocR family regulator